MSTTLAPRFSRSRQRLLVATIPALTAGVGLLALTAPVAPAHAGINSDLVQSLVKVAKKQAKPRWITAKPA